MNLCNPSNQASVSEAGDGDAIGIAVVATLMACGAGGVTVMMIWKFIPGGGGAWSLSKTINGCLAGRALLILYSNKFIGRAIIMGT